MKDLDSGITLHCYMDKFVYIKPTQIDEYKNADYHIYLICSMPKSYFVENSIKFTSNNLACELIQNNKTIKIEHSYLEIFDGTPISGTSFQLNKDKSILTLSYYKSFVKQKDIIISANEIYGASGLMKSKKEKLLYIGQSFGKKTSRTSAERLSNHATLQKILADNQSFGGDDEIQLYLMNFKMNHILQLSGMDKQTNMDSTANKFFDTMNDYNQRMCIDLVEACLINYFKPQYNTQYKNKILNVKSSKFKIFYDNGITRISVQILPDTYSDKVLKQKNIRMPQIILYTDSASYDTADYHNLIVSDLDKNLYSTYAQLKNI